MDIPLMIWSIHNFNLCLAKFQIKILRWFPKQKKALQHFVCRGPLHLLSPAHRKGKQMKGKEKGEEKPEEELMGKRKSSPWLATTSAWMLSLLIMDSLPISIHATMKNSPVLL
jgi:hypothetical protein